MSSSAIPHVVAFLTRPLLPAFPYAAVSSAQLILSASLAVMPSATLSLTPTSIPAPLVAASVGAAIPWAAWLSALGSDNIMLFYAPGYVKVRLGNAAVTDVWSETSQGSVLPIARAQAQTKVGPSPLLQQNTGARLRAMLLSARVRNMRRAAAAEATSTSDDADSSDSDSESDSDSASSTSSKFTAFSNDSLTSVGSSPTTPPKSAPIALPAVGVYRPPFARAKVAAKTVTVLAKTAAPKASPPPAANHTKKDTTAYLYQGGVTRVMTGGVMLGPRRF